VKTKRKIYEELTHQKPQEEKEETNESTVRTVKII
jgi:hypothetical protein